MFAVKVKYLFCTEIVLLLILFYLHVANAIGVPGYVAFCVLIVFLSLPIICRCLLYIIFLINDLQAKSIIVNAFVFMGCVSLKRNNLGDDLNWFLVKKMSRLKVSLLKNSIVGRLSFFNRENYLIIGSVITFLANPRTVVWGAGAIDDCHPLKIAPQKVCAVRGPLTRKFLLDNGVACPPVYGDPAMLLKFFYKPTVEKKYKLGIIPHYTDFFSKKFENIRNRDDVLFIKMQNYDSVENAINQIASCECILSSSLHGLIISETYDIPNVWIKVSDNVNGGTFKFCDYYESIGISDCKPYLFSGQECVNDLLRLFKDYKKGHIDLTPLISACPFDLTLNR